MMEGATWCQLVDLNEYANGGGGGWVGERVYRSLFCFKKNIVL